jgi:hypothetical protein
VHFATELLLVFMFFYCFNKNNINAYGLSHVVHNSKSRRARIDLLTFIGSADPNYPRLGVFTAVIKKNSKTSGSVISLIYSTCGLCTLRYFLTILPC